MNAAMNKSNHWVMVFLYIGLIIYFLSPGPLNLITNFNAWEIREQIIFSVALLLYHS